MTHVRCRTETLYFICVFKRIANNERVHLYLINHNKRLKVDNRQKTLTQTGFLSKGNIEEPTKKGDDAHTTETNQPTDTETNEHKKTVASNC